MKYYSEKRKSGGPLLKGLLELGDHERGRGDTNHQRSPKNFSAVRKGVKTWTVEEGEEPFPKGEEKSQQRKT